MIDRTPGSLARKHLDKALFPFKEVESQLRPPRGWVRAIRDALGMTSRQLAARMGLSQSTIAALEKGEVADTVTLKTLREAAAALDCQLVYALVPRTTLDQMVRERANSIAEKNLARVHHTMRLENQALRDSELVEERERIVRYLLEGRPSHLWEDA